MKNSIQTLILVLMVIVPCLLTAQNYIAMQHGNSLSQYTNLDSAIVHAQSGDYVYIPGGTFALTKTINKKLFIYGAGHYPDSTSATGYTYITGNLKLVTGADGSIIEGLALSGNFTLGTDATNEVVNNIAVKKCRIDGSVTLYNVNGGSNNIYFGEGVLRGSVDGKNATQTYFEKNIFESSIVQIINGVFRNNLFLLSSACGCYVYSCYDCSPVFGSSNANLTQNCLFENNIIYDSNPMYADIWNAPDQVIQNCFFNNNLFIHNQSFPYYTNTGNNNIVNQSQSSIFVNQTGNSFSYSHDYHLKPTCPGKNAGTDGTDIGIYGTTMPYKDGAVPANPHIRYKQITTTSNTINVNVKVAAQDR